MQEVTGIKKILYHIKAWFRSLGLPMYNVRLWRVEGEKKEYIGSQFSLDIKQQNFGKIAGMMIRKLLPLLSEKLYFCFDYES